MAAFIAAALERSRTSLLLLAFLIIGGLAAYVVMPKESNPDVSIPVIYVSMSLEGIAPEDAERLLVRPMEQELRSLEGIKEMTSLASEGHASVTLNSTPASTPNRPWPMCARRSTTPAASCPRNPTSQKCTRSMWRCSRCCRWACPAR